MEKIPQNLRTPVRFERLALQSSTLELGSRAFLSRIREHCKAHGVNIQKILDLGCAIGDETRLLAEYFPAADILAIDCMDEYIGYAQSRTHRPGVSFKTLPTADPDAMAQIIAGSDLIYCRMFLMHEAAPKAYLRAIAQSMRPSAYLAAEEPDSSKIGRSQNSAALQRWVELLLCFGERRRESYRLGPELSRLLDDSGFEVEVEDVHQPQLVDEPHKQLLVQLAEDLAPKFSAFHLADPNELAQLNHVLKNEISSGSIRTIDYCEMTQLFARRC